MKPVSFAGLAILLVVVFGLSSLPGTPADAAPGSINLIAVDADRTNGPPAGGNLADDIGPIDRCISIANGGSVVIDVVVDAVPAFESGTYTGGIRGVGFDVLYDMRLVNVVGWETGIDSALHYSTNLAGPVNIDDPLPDVDGRYRLDSGDAVGSANPESGEGILAKITFQGIAQGISLLRVTDLLGETDLAKGKPRVLSADLTAYTVNNVQDGILAVGVACPADPADADGDSLANEVDNCPITRNGPAQASLPGTGNQTDSNTNGIGNACEERDRDSETPISHVCQGSCPGGAFRDSIETIIGTDPARRCAASEGANNEAGDDAWPLDFNDDQRANTADVGQYVPRLNSMPPDLEYSARFDLNANGVINTSDIGLFVPALNQSCATIADQYDSCPGSFADPVDALGCSTKQVDWDGDSKCDSWAVSGGPSNCTGANDNCWRTNNVAQTDTDSDGKGNACDPEGPGPNTDGVGGANDCTDGVDNDGDGQTDAADPLCGQTSDADNDRFADGLELFVGTLVNDACANTSAINDESPPDQWPVDLNDDQDVSTLDLGSFVGYIGSSGTTYSVRHDIVPDGVSGFVDILHVGYFHIFDDDCTVF
jgi:hypothetical protein